MHSNIATSDRAVLINVFRQVLYAENESDLADRLEEMYSDPQYSSTHNFRSIS